MTRNLPLTQFTPSRPFIKIGVDYCGIFWTQCEGKTTTEIINGKFLVQFNKRKTHHCSKRLDYQRISGCVTIVQWAKVQNLFSDSVTNFTGTKDQLRMQPKINQL